MFAVKNIPRTIGMMADAAFVGMMLANTLKGGNIAILLNISVKFADTELNTFLAIFFMRVFIVKAVRIVELSSSIHLTAQH